jgi:hypothetical protein
MTTFALMAGMMPVAIGVGEGGEFYSPMAVAIIGGTVVSTLLTLLVVPSFYDSIEIARERAGAKFRARAALGNPLFAFVATLFEAIFTILGLRALYRLARMIIGVKPLEHPVARAQRLGIAIDEPHPVGDAVAAAHAHTEPVAVAAADGAVTPPATGPRWKPAE